jgi:tetratricopeptide (TPR) repeat protein
MLLVGSCWPAYGQTTPEAKPSSEPNKNLAASTNGDVDRLIVSVIESSKSDPMSKEQLRQAIDTLTQQIAQSPSDVKLSVARAAAHVRLREMDEANKDLTLALNKAPNDRLAWYVFALMKIDATSPEFDPEAVKEGITALKKAHGLGYADPKLYAFLGAAHYRLGDKRRAINALTKAIEGNITEAYTWRGDLYAMMGDPQLAIADYCQAIELGFTEPRIYFQRASMYYEVKSYSDAISDYSRAIIAMPDLPGGYYGRALCYVAADDWNAAIKDFDRAAQIEPSCKLISERGCAYIKHKEYAKGIADIRKAIQLNQGDVGVTYEASTDKKLSSDALAHGERQVRQMLKDRAAMAIHVTPGDKMWTWAVRKFAGEDLGAPIDWDNADPDFAAAANIASDGKSNARILISPLQLGSPSKSASFEELWIKAVFELHNVQTSPETTSLDREAAEGKLTCDEYVLRILKREDLAVQRTRAFYINCYLAWMPKNVIRDTSPWSWYCTVFPTKFEDFAMPVGDDRPRRYATYFNHIQAIREFRLGNFAKVKECLKDVLSNESCLPFENRMQTRLMAGQIRVFENDLAGAIVDAANVLAIHPENERALHLRGNALALQGKFDEALVDYNHALRIKPDYAEVLSLRAIVFANRKDDKAALADLDRAINLKPQDAMMLSQRAKLLLESVDPAIRNPGNALKDAKQGCELSQWKSAYGLGVLASAYAALNDFDNAVKWQEKAMSLSADAEKEERSKSLEDFKKRQTEKK